MEPEIIKTESSYAATLNEIERLMELGTSRSNTEDRRLDLLVHLVEEYEKAKSVRPSTNPIDAILFRMEQSNLRQADLVPYIGSRSKVSEVLSGRRPLTLSMIQALSSGLSIPAKSLIEVQSPFSAPDELEDWSKYPIKEMCDRNWIPVTYSEARSDPSKVFNQFFAPVVGMQSIGAFYRKSSANIRTGRQMNRFSLFAWTTRVTTVALEDPPKKKWRPGVLTLERMRELARLSVAPDGPVKACETLREYGISLVIEPHLPKTYLDGAAILSIKDHPIIGLSLRHDRIDSFWFTLFHELAHVELHYNESTGFVDDLEVRNDDDPREVEADQLASEALIPEDKWKLSAASVFPSKDTLLRFARETGIHPAIVAGRMRKERNSYHLYNDLVGHGRIRYLFKLDTEE